jgi:hypothetical protein
MSERELIRRMRLFTEDEKEETTDDLYNKGDAEGKEDDQLTQGIAVEHEHKDLYDMLKDKINMAEEDFYKTISAAHLKEIPDYYTRLKKMEDEAKSGKDSEKENSREEPKEAEHEKETKPGIASVTMLEPKNKEHNGF